MPILTPHWFQALDPNDPDDIALKVKYFVKSAALVHSPGGTLQELAKAIGVSKPILTYAYTPHRGPVGLRLAARLEEVVGADVLPRKLLRPDVDF